jgi:hypothetical protein
VGRHQAELDEPEPAPAEVVLVGLWTLSLGLQDVVTFVGSRLERLYHSDERRRGCRIGVLWEGSAWPDVRHAEHFVAMFPHGIDTGLLVMVEPGDRFPGWVPGSSLAVGRDVLLSQLGRGMRDMVRVALPAEGKALDDGVVLVGRGELWDALARVQAKPPRPPGPDAGREEHELLLEDHMAAAVGLALWGAEQGWGDLPLPRDSLEAMAQEHGRNKGYAASRSARR